MIRNLTVTLAVLLLTTMLIADVPLNIETADAGAKRETTSTSRIKF